MTSSTPHLSPAPTLAEMQPLHPAIASLAGAPDLVAVEIGETASVKTISIRFGNGAAAPMTSFIVSKTSGRLRPGSFDLPSGERPDPVADFAFGHRPTRPFAFALGQARSIAVGMDVAPEEWRLNEVLGSVADAIHVRINDTYRHHIRPHLSDHEIRVLNAFWTASIFDWPTYVKVCESEERERERLAAFVERNPLIGVQVLAAPSGFDVVRFGGEDVAAFTAAKKGIEAVRAAGHPYDPALHAPMFWNEALFRRAVGFTWEHPFYEPVKFLRRFAEIPLDWFPSREDTGAFAYVMQAAIQSRQDVGFGRNTTVSDAIPGCRGRWTAYAHRLDEGLGRHAGDIMRDRSKPGVPGWMTMRHGPLNKISRRFRQDILVPLGLLFADEAPTLARVAAIAMRGPAREISELAKALLYQGMDLPSRHALAVRHFDATPSIAGAVARHPPTGVDLHGRLIAPKAIAPSTAISRHALADVWSAWKPVMPRRLRVDGLAALAAAIEEEILAMPELMRNLIEVERDVAEILGRPHA